MEDEIARLATYVRRMEARYEYSSEAADAAIRDGHLKETAEVSRWLSSFRALKTLSGSTDVGPATGTPTSAIR